MPRDEHRPRPAPSAGAARPAARRQARLRHRDPRPRRRCSGGRARPSRWARRRGPRARRRAAVGGGRGRPQDPRPRGAGPASTPRHARRCSRGWPPRPRSRASSSFELSASLYAIREVLRERLPRCAVSEDAAGGPRRRARSSPSTNARSGSTAGCTTGRARGGDAGLARGRPRRADRDAPSATSVPTSSSSTPALGGRAQPRPRLHRHMSSCPRRAGSRAAGSRSCGRPTASQLEIAVPGGQPRSARDPLDDPRRARPARARSAAASPPTTAGPALTRLQQRMVGEREIDSVDVYGEPPRQPAVSIVVPLYKRLDFIEHQLLQFSRDPEFAAVDLGLRARLDRAGGRAGRAGAGALRASTGCLSGSST